MNKSIKVVGDRVSELRKALGYSQSEFAMALNNRFGASVKQSAISHIEAGRKQPSIELLGGMAIVLETTADYLLGLSDNEKRPGNHSQGDEITLTVEDEKRRGELYEMAIILKAMKPFDFALVRQLILRIQRVQIEMDTEEDHEWLQLWDTVFTFGGATFVRQLERQIGVRMPKHIQAKLEAAGLLG